MNHVLISTGFLLILSLMTGCANQPSPGEDQTAILTLATWQQAVSNSVFSGTVHVAQGGETVFRKSFGMANRAENQAFDNETVFDIGSITKQFTAAAILKLAEQNKLSVNDTLNRFFQDVPLEKTGITVHQLLTHSSGLPHGFGLYDIVEKEAFIKRAFDSTLLSSPGDSYHYSNVGYSLLAIIIEKVSNTGWEQFISEQFLKPAGLSNTGYRLVEYSAEDLAINYGRDPNPLQRLLSLQADSKSVGSSLEHQYKEPGPRWYMQGAGGLLSTVQDMHLWYQVLREGQLLNAASWQTIFTPHIAVNDAATSHYGYGWAIDKNESGEQRIFHNGSNGYTFAEFTYFPQKDIFIFYTTNNRDDMPQQLFEQLENAVFATIDAKPMN